MLYNKVVQFYIYTCIIFHSLFYDSLLQDFEYSSLCYTVGPCCLSILYSLHKFLVVALGITPSIHNLSLSTGQDFTSFSKV